MLSHEESLKQGGFAYLEERKEINIEWEGKPAIVVIKKISNKEMAICRRSTEQRVVGKEMVIKPNPDLYRDLLIQNGVFSAPFDHKDLNAIQKLKPNFADALANEILIYNDISEEKKED